MKNAKVAVIGGDKRMFFCAEALYEKGLEPALFGFERISDRANSTRCATLGDCIYECSAVILPLPVSRDGEKVTSSSQQKISLDEVFAAVPLETPIFAGLVSDSVRKLAAKYGHIICDYYTSEAFTMKNACATAEGAVYLAMKNSERTLRTSKCLVTGYGRIAEFTARLLSAFGAYVTVCARNPDARIRAELCGYITTDFGGLPESIRGYDFIFNTVPSPVFDEHILSKMSSTQLFIELASAPYGADRAIAKKYNVEIIDGAALPSKYCPQSAGEYIAGEIVPELERMGII